MGRGVGLGLSSSPQVNKFEQVSSDGHQVSLGRGRGPRSDVKGWGGLRWGEGAGVYSEVQYIMGNNQRGSPPLWTDRMTGTHD